VHQTVLRVSCCVYLLCLVVLCLYVPTNHPQAPMFQGYDWFWKGFGPIDWDRWLLEVIALTAVWGMFMIAVWRNAVPATSEASESADDCEP